MTIHRPRTPSCRFETQTTKSSGPPAIKINGLQITIGIISLIFGAVFYLVDRISEQIYFLSFINIPTIYHLDSPKVFGELGNHLPSFIHVFSFILLTSGLVFSGNKRNWLTLCGGWFLLDFIFELGQKYPYFVSGKIPVWFQNIPFLENCGNYFQKGRFDIFDVMSIGLGTIAACIVLHLTTKGGNGNENF